MKTLQDRIALVTGASRGIGAAIAERLAAEGATVICTARTLDASGDHLPGSLQERVATIEKRGGRAVAMQCDVGDPAARTALMEQVLAQFGRVDILINNAATAFFVPVEKVSDKWLRRTFEINLYAPLQLSQSVLPGMRERGWGRIVNISSASAEIPPGPPYHEYQRFGGPMVYGASKLALNRMTAGLAAELEGSGIAVNNVAPVSAVMTPGVEAGMKAQNIDPNHPDYHWEPVEAMAEATLALCLVDPAVTNGSSVYSLPYLQQLGRVVHTLDGRGPLQQ